MNNRFDSQQRKCKIFFSIRSQESSISIATRPQASGWTNEELEFNSQQEKEIFIFSTASRLGLRPTQSPTQ
jgi:hypothetical protein